MIVRCVALTLLLVAFTSAEPKVRYDNYQVFRVKPETLTQLLYLNEIQKTLPEFSFWTEPTSLDRNVDIMTGPNHVEKLKSLLNDYELEFEISISNVQEVIDNQKVTPMAEGDEFKLDVYHTLEEINAWLVELTKKNPKTVTLIEAGKTTEGRIITGVKVSYSPENENRAIMIDANIHAREWISGAVALYTLNEVLTSTNTTIRRIAESHDWYFLPVLNADGFEYTHTTDRMWRKTRTPNKDVPECVGVDPNRNWDWHWNEEASGSDPCSEAYAGETAFSDPTTASLSEYIKTVGNKLQVFITLHSYSQLMLIPYGYTAEHLDNFDQLLEIGLKAAASLKQRYGTRYKVGNIVETIYKASGGNIDWVKGTFKVPITYALELRDTGRHGFLLPENLIIPTCEETMDAFVTMILESNKAYKN